MSKTIVIAKKVNKKRSSLKGKGTAQPARQPPILPKPKAGNPKLSLKRQISDSTKRLATHPVRQVKHRAYRELINTKRRKGESWLAYAIRRNREKGHKATKELLDLLYKISGDKKYYNRALKDKGRVTSNFVYLVLSTQKKLFPLKKERNEWDGILGDKTIKRGKAVLNEGLSFKSIWTAIKKFFADVGSKISGWWDSFVKWIKSFVSEKDPKKQAVGNLADLGNETYYSSSKRRNVTAKKYETFINGTRIDLPASSWESARDAGKTMKQVLKGVSNKGYKYVRDLIEEFEITDVRVSSLLRGAGGGPHTSGRGLDLTYFKTKNLGSTTFYNTSVASTEPSLAKKIRIWSWAHSNTSQVIGPWYHRGVRGRPPGWHRNRMRPGVEWDHRHHLHITIR